MCIPTSAMHLKMSRFSLQYELSDDEKKDLEYDLDDLSMVTDGEEDEHDTTTFTETLQQLGMLGSIEEKKFQPDDIKTIQSLLHGLTLAQQGHEMLAKGCEQIKQVVARVPSVHKLQGLLQVIKSTDPSLVEAARGRSKMPQTGKVAQIKLYRPKSIAKSNSYQCRVCDQTFGLWVGCDSHIRAVHTNIQYGPCRGCHSFTSTAYDTFKRHEAKCFQTDKKQ